MTMVEEDCEDSVRYEVETEVYELPNHVSPDVDEIEPTGRAHTDLFEKIGVDVDTLRRACDEYVEILSEVYPDGPALCRTV